MGWEEDLQTFGTATRKGRETRVARERWKQEGAKGMHTKGSGWKVAACWGPVMRRLLWGIGTVGIRGAAGRVNLQVDLCFLFIFAHQAQFHWKAQVRPEAIRWCCSHKGPEGGGGGEGGGFD